MSLRGRRAFAVLAVVGAAALTFTVVEHARRPSQLLARAERTAQETSAEIAVAIDDELRDVERRVHDLATRLMSGELDRGSLGDAAREHLASNPGLYGLAPAYAPLPGGDPDLYSPYWRRCDGEIVEVSADENLDYTLADPGPVLSAARTHWYHVPMARGRAWVEPYYCVEGETLMISYGERFVLRAEADRAAIMLGDLSLARLRELLARFPVGRTGYAFVVSEENRVVAHPDRALLGLSLDEILEGDLAGPAEEAVLRTLTGALGAPSSDPTSPGVDRSHTMHIETIDRAGWSLVTVFDPAEIVPTMTTERRSRTAILLSAFPWIVGCVGCLIPPRRGRARRLAVATVLTLSFVAGIGLQWHWALRFSSEVDEETFPISDESEADAVLARLLPIGPGAADAGSAPADRIRTGVFVQSARFVGPYNVTVTGYLWQRFADGRDLERAPGVILPEAESVTLERVASGDGFVRWYFVADLRQSFDYASYPIDREHVWIRLWPADFDRAVILVPDFAAYDDMSPEARPGLEEDFVLEGWDCIGTHFSYRANSYGVDFGADDFAAHNDRPELYFNIDLRRKFIGPFVSDLMPMLVVAALLFSILMIQVRKDDEGLLGFSASTVLSYCAGLFFVLIISHVYVREKLAVPQIIYIEWFYFTMYALLLLLSLNAVRFARGRRLRWFGLEDTRLVTLIYWPVTAGILFLVTLATFA